MKQRVTIRGDVTHRRRHTLSGDIIIAGDIEVHVEDLESYVQVEFDGGGSYYTYRDPSGTLEVGDLVDVPTRYDEHNVAQVKRLGRGDYTGRVADVQARFLREQLCL